MNGPTSPSPTPAATYTTPRAAGSGDDLRGRVCVITGATRGIGRATAMELATLGAEVVMIGRDEKRLDEVRVDARRVAGNDRVFWVRADFSSLDSVRQAAEEVSHRWQSIHVLVNNAGINSPRRATSADGYELTFAINHLAPFLLTTVLMRALSRGAPSRVVNVSSVFANFGRMDLDDAMYERRRYTSTRAYNQSKLANVMFTMELAARVASSGISVNCVFPGLVATELMREHWWFTARWLRPLWRKALMTPTQAAQRIIRVATAETLATITGECFAASDQPIAAPGRSRDAEAGQRLWDLSVRLTNAPDISSFTARSR